MLRTRAFVTTALLLSGCAKDMRSLHSDFLITGPDTFQLHSQEALDLDEADHLRYIAGFLAERHMCPGGYVITDTRQEPLTHSLFGDVNNVYYRSQTAFSTLDPKLRPAGTTMINLSRLYRSTIGVAVVQIFAFDNAKPCTWLLPRT